MSIIYIYGAGVGVEVGSGVGVRVGVGAGVATQSSLVITVLPVVLFSSSVQVGGAIVEPGVGAAVGGGGGEGHITQ